jgi:hypothetical protein
MARSWGNYSQALMQSQENIVMGRQGAHHSDIQHNDTRPKDIYHNSKNAALNIITRSVMTFNGYAECHYAEVHLG